MIITNNVDELDNYLQNDLNVHTDRTKMLPLSSDIVIGDKGIAIDLTVPDAGHSKIRASERRALAAEQSLRLIQISATEWLYHKDIVKSKLRHLFGKTATVFNARQLTIKRVEQNDARVFFNATHIQGAPRGGFVAYALVNQEDQIQACIAVAPVKEIQWRRTDCNLDVRRYSTALNTSIRGGYTRLIAHVFKSNPHIDQLITFADRLWSNGDLYRSTKWTMSGHVAPMYQYVHASNAMSYHRTHFTKSKIAIKFADIYDSLLTEREMMSKTPYIAVYDAGKLRYVLNKPTTM